MRFTGRRLKTVINIDEALGTESVKKWGELCGSRLILGLRIESRIPFVELLSEFFI
jgi:hypothetical protein